jgi:hypothetical protein
MENVAMAKKQDASRLRQRLVRTEAARDKHLQVLLEARPPLLRGAFVVVGKKCGKPTCRCTTGELHPSRYLSSSEEGRTRMRYVPATDEARVRAAAERYRDFREARAALARLSDEVLAMADALQTCLTEPYPPPNKGEKTRQAKGPRSNERAKEDQGTAGCEEGSKGANEGHGAGGSSQRR